MIGGNAGPRWRSGVTLILDDTDYRVNTEETAAKYTQYMYIYSAVCRVLRMYTGDRPEAREKERILRSVERERERERGQSGGYRGRVQSSKTPQRVDWRIDG